MPLLDPDRELLVIWGAKCACSVTYVWYLKVIGEIDQFRASGTSPHEHRAMHYRSSDAFRRGRTKPLTSYRFVHVIRDPYLRTVSSYRHVLAFPFDDRRLAACGVGPLDRRVGFSFSRYLDFIETLDFDRANVHYRPQLHRIESLKPADLVINISKGRLFEDLNRLEEELAIPRTNFDDLGWFLGWDSQRKARTTTFGGDVPNLTLNVRAASGRAPWPDYEEFLTPPVRRRIERLYARDFEAFGTHL